MGLQSFLELYPSSGGPTPSNVRVEWSLIGDGASQPVAQTTVVPTSANDRLTAAGQFALASLKPGIYEVRATILVNEIVVGAVSTTVRKVLNQPGGVSWASLDDCRGRCTPR